MLRGNAGEPVIFDESDRYCFYLLVQEGAGRYVLVFDLCGYRGGLQPVRSET